MSTTFSPSCVHKKPRCVLERQDVQVQAISIQLHHGTTNFVDQAHTVLYSPMTWPDFSAGAAISFDLRTGRAVPEGCKHPHQIKLSFCPLLLAEVPGAGSRAHVRRPFPRIRTVHTRPRDRSAAAPPEAPPSRFRTPRNTENWRGQAWRRVACICTCALRHRGHRSPGAATQEHCAAHPATHSPSPDRRPLGCGGV